MMFFEGWKSGTLGRIVNMAEGSGKVDARPGSRQAASGDDSDADVLIVGLGYVGLSLATAFARAGLRVVGFDTDTDVVSSLRRGVAHVREPGLAGILRGEDVERFSFGSSLPGALPANVVVCVGTAFDGTRGQTRLSSLETAVRSAAGGLSRESLLVIRSTVPVGTTRRMASLLRGADPLLAYCPQRTIQGVAIRELGSLPHVVGGLNESSVERAVRLFSSLGAPTVRVSSLEAAEMVKLINNAHTDIIYGFGNEVALMAETLGLDATELIRAANLDYPRPDLSMPGFVGGSCLTKDPYLLAESLRNGGRPRIAAAARQVNEAVPRSVARRVLERLRTLGKEPAQCRVALLGFAYKGVPETDDLRGSPVLPILEALRTAVGAVCGHDDVVPRREIAALEVEPVSLEEAFRAADAVLVLNNHPCYRTCDAKRLVDLMRRPAVLFDAWGVLRDALTLPPAGVEYLVLGRG